MSPINGANNHSSFFPINFDDSSKINNEKNITESTTNSTGSDPDFQIVMKSLLENRINSWCYSLNSDDSSDVRQPLFSLACIMPLMGIENNTKALQALLNQLQQPDLSAKYSTQINPPSSTRIFTGSDLIENQGNDNLRSIPGFPDSSVPGVNPSQQEVVAYITKQCRELGIPEQLGLATAATESGMTQFNKDGTPCRNSNPSSSDWGIMQINDKAWGSSYDMNRIKSDWQYNVRAGLEILKDCYNNAIRNDEGSKGANNADQNLAQAAYSSYNAGSAAIWRYRTPVDAAPRTTPYAVLNDGGYDLRDIRFWNNYQKLS